VRPFFFHFVASVGQSLQHSKHREQLLGSATLERAHVSVLEIFCKCACFDFGNFRFKLPIERIFKEGEDGTVFFVIKTVKFFKIRCHTCSYVTLIPTFGEFRVTGPIHCEDCGKLILMKTH